MTKHFGIALALVTLASSVVARAQETPPRSVGDGPGFFLHLGGRLMGTQQQAHGAIDGATGLRYGPLRVGVAAAYAPATFNPRRYERALPEGTTYRGQSTLRLGAQEAMFGVYLSGVFDIPGVSWLSIETPVTVGGYFLGTPLVYDDRETPDGRRVSEWEDEITGGSDTNLVFGLDVGVRARVRVPEVPWLSLGLGFHYTFVVGYESQFVDGSSLHGPSGSLALIFEG